MDVALPPEIDERLENEADRQLARKIAIGMEVGNFLRSSLGLHLVNIADAESQHFREQFDSVDATDTASIRNLQLEIAARKVWQEWLAAMITDGDQAQIQLHERMSQ